MNMVKLLEIKTKEEIDAETNIAIANESFLINQVSGYIEIAKRMEKDLDLGFVDKNNKILRIASMLQKENIYGTQES